MPKTGCYNGVPERGARRAVLALLLALLAPLAASAGSGPYGERFDGFYRRDGNDASPAVAAGNNIYLKFFEDRWIALLFVPYPGAGGVDAGHVGRALEAARARVGNAAFLRGRFGVLEQPATAQIERYGYLRDGRIAFECGALSACTIRLGDDMIELVKPGVINEHIVRYLHVDAE